MLPGYQGVLQRLKEERIRNGMSQADLCREIGMLQSHYCKVEQGRNYFSYEHLKKINATNMDLHFIFTGNRSQLADFPRLQEVTRNGDWTFIGQFFYVQVEHICNLQITHEKYREINRQNQVMRFILNSGKSNLMRLTRYYYEWSQETMAERLDIDIKKCSGLETGKIHPNSEMVFLFYQHFRIPPQIILGDDRGIIRAICDIMEELTAEERSKIIQLLALEKELFG
ncbi:MAG: helix-turn-helix domain-containing protein [Lachnospiraceae bacterium]|nr:helix-turn-helix domain-containing protein [Lachnospiraceae bacterium]